MSASTLRHGIMTEILGSKKNVAEFIGGWTDMGIFATRNRTGLRIVVEFYQNNKRMLRAFTAAFPAADGTVTRDSGASTGQHHHGELGWVLRYVGQKALPILQLLAQHSIMNAVQAERAARVLELRRQAGRPCRGHTANSLLDAAGTRW
jgi:hypothetical protein